MSEAPCSLDVEWVVAFRVGERSGRYESGGVDRFWLLLVVEVKEAIASNRWKESLGHVVWRPLLECLSSHEQRFRFRFTCLTAALAACGVVAPAGIMDCTTEPVRNEGNPESINTPAIALYCNPLKNQSTYAHTVDGRIVA